MKRHAWIVPLPWALVVGLALVACGPSGDGGKDAAPSAECEAYDFDCGDGEQCVDSDVVCDGTEDCNTGADEVGCGGCDPGWMPCDDGQCIHAAFVCDGVFNCTDHSDEDNCPGP